MYGAVSNAPARSSKEATVVDTIRTGRVEYTAVPCPVCGRLNPCRCYAGSDVKRVRLVPVADVVALLDELLAGCAGQGSVLMRAAQKGARQALTEAKRRIEGGE